MLAGPASKAPAEAIPELSSFVGDKIDFSVPKRHSPSLSMVRRPVRTVGSTRLSSPKGARPAVLAPWTY